MTSGTSQSRVTSFVWSTKDFYIEDPDGYIVCFGGRAAGLSALLAAQE